MQKFKFPTYFHFDKIFGVIFLLILGCYSLFLFWASFYNFSNTFDGFSFSTEMTWIKSLKYNYFSTNGRWGQGISNDYRFYKYREFTISAIIILYYISNYFFTRIFVKKRMSIILSTIVTLTTSIIYYYYYHLFFWLPTANSYTIAFSLSLILYYLIYRLLNNESKKIQFKELLISTIISIVMSGLAELITIPLIFMLLALNCYLFLFKKTINNGLLYLTILNIIGFLVLFFSPGNVNRRRDEASDSIVVDFFEVFSNITSHLEINKYTILLFIASLSVFLYSKQKKINFKPLGLLFILCSLLIYLITPVALGYLSGRSNALLRMYNVMCFHFPIVIICLSYILSNFIHLKENLNKGLLLFTLSASVVLYSFSFFKEDNNVGILINNLLTNKMQSLYVQEMSNRCYLIENKGVVGDKIIPTYKNKDFNVIPYTPYDRFIDENNKFKSKPYINAYNNRNDLYLLDTLKISPNINFAVFLHENNKLQPSFRNSNIEICYLKDFNVISIKLLNPDADINFKYKLNYKAFLKLNTRTVYSSFEEEKLNDRFYYRDKSTIGIDLPHNTIKVDFYMEGEKIALAPILFKDLKLRHVETFNSTHNYPIMN